MDDETVGCTILKGSTGANAGKMSGYLLKTETKKSDYKKWDEEISQLWKMRYEANKSHKKVRRDLWATDWLFVSLNVTSDVTGEPTCLISSTLRAQDWSRLRIQSLLYRSQAPLGKDYFRTTIFFPANFVTLLAVIWLDGEHYFSAGTYTPNNIKL